MKIAQLWVFCVLISASTAFAQIPRVISYQGVLTDTLGNAKADGNYQFTFQLFTVATGGGPHWSESKSLAVKGGLFATMLGDQSSFPDSVRFDRAYWLSLQVSSDLLTPRIRLGAVGYAMNSLRADTARFAFASAVGANSVVSVSIQDGAITTSKLADAAVTGTKLASNAVTGSHIADGSITTVDVAGSFKAPKADTATYSLNSAIAANSVGTGTLQDAAVTEFKLDTSAVTTAKIKNGAVTDTKIASVDAAKISSGTVGDARLSTNVTKQGNSFNGADQLVKLTNLGVLPALDGSALTNVGASSLAGGTYTNAFTFSNASNNFTGNGSGLTSLSAASISGVLPVANGGTGSSTQNFVDLGSNQTVGGSKTFAPTADVSGLIVRRNSFVGGDPTADAFRVTTQDGSSNLFSISYGGVLSGYGTGLTGLNASNISSGTLNDARLSGNVAKLTYGNTNYVDDNSSGFVVYNSGLGTAANFNVGNGSNGASALYSSTIGTGPAGTFEILSPSNSGDAVFGVTKGSGSAIKGQSSGGAIAVHGVSTNTGTGGAGRFEIANSSNVSPAVYAGTSGTGQAGYFYIDNGSNSNEAVLGNVNSGSGTAVRGIMSGTGQAANFTILNGSNANQVLFAQTSGDGIAGYFQNIKGANTSPVLQADNSGGSGPAVKGTTSGAGRAGEFLNNSSGTEALYAKNNGSGNAALLDGAVKVTGNLGVAGSLSLKHVTVSATTSYTPGNEAVILVSTSGLELGTTINLPDASTAPERVYYVKKINGGAYVTITPPEGQTIDGNASQVLYAVNDRVMIISDGSNWFILGSFITSF